MITPSTTANMKLILFSLLLCIAGIYAGRDTDIKTECATEYGINLTEVGQAHKTFEEAIEFVTPHKMGCIVACCLRKDLMGESTITEHIQNALQPEPEFPFTPLSDEDHTKYSKIANDCIAKANGDDCELMSCLKAWDRPFDRILLI